MTLATDTPWMRAQDADKYMAGATVWQYCEKDDTMIITMVPKNFSRDPHHCVGIWWMEIVRPAIPAQLL